MFSTANASENMKKFFGFAIPVVAVSFSLDEDVKNLVKRNKTETFDDISSFFNQFGSAEAVLIPIVGYGYGILSKNKSLEDNSRKAFYASVIAASIVFPLKYITNRERPDKSDNRSFPSGHTAVSFAIFGTYAKNSGGIKKYFLYSIPFMVGFSRVYKNHHYFSDVVAGGIIGYLSVILADKFDKFSIKRIKAVPFCSISKKSAGLGFEYQF